MNVSKNLDQMELVEQDGIDGDMRSNVVARYLQILLSSCESNEGSCNYKGLCSDLQQKYLSNREPGWLRLSRT